MPKRKAPPKKLSKGQMTLGKGGKLKKQKKKKKEVPAAQLQDHIAHKVNIRGEPVPHQEKVSNKREAIIRGSKGQVGVNPKLSKDRHNVRYGETTGKGGPNAEAIRSIHRRIPIPVTDSRQLIIPTTNNRIPRTGRDDYHKIPMQQMTSTRGGFHSGRVKDLM